MSPSANERATSDRPVEASGIFAAGPLRFHRLGYGAMQLTGPGIWGPPKDREAAIAVLRRAVELGVDFVDTADSYGPYVSEELIREALHPYPEDLVIATKAGLTRSGPNDWRPVGRPEYLRQECEMSLRRLGAERLDLFQLHRVDPKVPADEQFGLLADLVAEGKVAAVGLSEVDVAQIAAARRVVPVVTVQNHFNLVERRWEAVLDHCETEGIGFIPWFPVASGRLARPGGPLERIAGELGRSPAQVALAWLLRRSPVMVPIPGTSSVAHVEENCAAAEIELADDQFATLDDAGRGGTAAA